MKQKGHAQWAYAFFVLLFFYQEVVFFDCLFSDFKIF